MPSVATPVLISASLTLSSNSQTNTHLCLSPPLQPVPIHAVIRTIATARIVMPKTIIRLAAGRYQFNETEQAMVSRWAGGGGGFEGKDD